MSSEKKTRNRNWICQKCGLDPKSKEDLKVHLKKVHKQKYIFVKCDYDNCGTVHQTYDDLDIHLTTKHKLDPSFKCEMHCGKNFTTFGKMRKHLTSVHKKFANPEIKAKIYKCEKCDKEFGYKKGLQYHVEKVCGIKPKDKICEICDKSFYSKFQLRNHQVSQNHRIQQDPGKFARFGERISAIWCTLCEIIFASDGEFQKHYISTHLKNAQIIEIED